MSNLIVIKIKNYNIQYRGCVFTFIKIDLDISCLYPLLKHDKTYFSSITLVGHDVFLGNVFSLFYFKPLSIFIKQKEQLIN